MRTGRNSVELLMQWCESLDHWDMRTGRNKVKYPFYSLRV